MKQHWTKSDRVAAANRIMSHLKAKPEFWLMREKLMLRIWGNCRWTGKTVNRDWPVIITSSGFLKSHDRHPWGGNQGQAIAEIAQWVRTGKIKRTVEGWERCYGSPVRLGNPEFLATIKREIYDAKGSEDAK